MDNHPYTLPTSSCDTLDTTDDKNTKASGIKTPSDILSTTILARNVHCASCVAHIEDLLDQDKRSRYIIHVGVSIVSGEINVLHEGGITPKDLCGAIAGGAFEVYSATTVDINDHVLSELSFIPSDGLLGEMTDRWRQVSPKSTPGPPYRPTRVPGKSKQHLQNCRACQEKEAEEARHVSLPATPHARDEKRHEPPVRSEPAKFLEHKTSPFDISEKGPPDKPDSAADLINYNQSLDVECFRLVISIGGMSCSSCVANIKDALQELDMVETADVELMTNSATVSFGGSKDLSQSILETLENLGYETSISSITAGVAKRPPVESARASELTYRASLGIGGMTCSSCTSAISAGVEDLQFVDKVEVSLMTHSAVIVFRGSENVTGIIERIEELGYDCSLESTDVISESTNKEPRDILQHRTLQLKVSGFFCENCPSRVMDALKCVYGERLKIDKPATLDEPILTITYTSDASLLTVRDIIATINHESDSFTTTIYHPPSLEERSRMMQLHERKRILWRLLLSFVIAVPTFLIGIVGMSLLPAESTLRLFLEAPMWAGQVSRAEWALFLLATPVLFFSADIFHIRAAKEIRALWRRGNKAPFIRRFYRFGSMNLLISAGTNVAYVSSFALLVIGATNGNYGMNSPTYFDTVVFLTFFILIGRYLEAYSKSKAGDAVSMLGKLRPRKAQLVLFEPGPWQATGSEEEAKPARGVQTIDADLLELGDHVIVSQGSSPPADGVVVSGKGRFDESSLTGESRPVEKVVGDKVFVGTINNGSPVTIRVTDIGGTSMLDQIIAVVREGQARRAPVERIADVLTGYFVPIITFLAIITFLIWFALGQSGRLSPTYLGGQAGGWAFWSLEYAIAVFVVACPCGVGLAAPTALFVGGGLTAKHGILARGGGEAFQEAGDLDAIVFDKTGTLTEGGDMRVTDYVVLSKDSEELAWTIVRSLEEQSSHPVAQAVLEFTADKATTTLLLESIAEEPGAGMRGRFVQPSPSSDTLAPVYEAALGSEAFMGGLRPTPPEVNYFVAQSLATWQSQSKSIAILAVRKISDDPRRESPWTVSTIFAISDLVRPSALPTIQNLQARGLGVYMLSGDNPRTACAVASSLGIPIANVFAGVLPAQKAEKIIWLQENLPRRPKTGFGHRCGEFLARLGPRAAREVGGKKRAGTGRARVAFVGDGINDAPALSTADISISPCNASPIALTSSSFILLSPSLLAIPTLLDISARVFGRVKLNFMWACAYNIVLVPVAAGVLFKVRDDGWRLGPVWGSVAMAGSSVSVVVSSLLLRWEGRWLWWRKAEGERREETER